MVDDRILAKFQEEFASSQKRLIGAQQRLAEWSLHVQAAQADIDTEQGLQQAMSDTLAQLGVTL